METNQSVTSGDEYFWKKLAIKNRLNENSYTHGRWEGAASNVEWGTAAGGGNCSALWVWWSSCCSLQIPAGSSANVLGIEPQVVFIFVLVCGVHGEARRLQKERNNKIKIRTNDLIRKCTCSNTKHNWTNFFPATRLYLSFPRASLSARVSVEKKKEWTVYGETFTYTHFWFLNINFGIETWLYSRHRCYL